MSPRTPEQFLLDDLTSAQRSAVLHEGNPLLIVAGAGTGKTTVITRRIAWLIVTKRARPEDILALTFTEKAAMEMEERVDVLVPYGYVNVAIRTFHAFGDQLLREHALKVGRSPQFRVLSLGEQLVFLRQHVFQLPLESLRPLNDPARYLGALATAFARAKDETVSPTAYGRYAQELQQWITQRPDDEILRAQANRTREVAEAYAVYQRLLQETDAVDFGDQVLLAIELLEHHPDVLAALRARYRYILVDEFQDTNYAQFRLLQLLTRSGSNITVVADDDQSIYKWRGAAISNVLKFLEHFEGVRTIVLTENFRSTQPILDCAYRAIRCNDPDRLEVRQGIDKRLVAHRGSGDAPHLRVFDTVSHEADWVAQTIRETIEGGTRRPNDMAILVRSNREADVFLRALNVAGVPWRFSGASGLLARDEAKLLLSCLKTLADPDDSLSWYHVASSPLYRCPMADLTTVLAQARRTHESFRAALERVLADPASTGLLSEGGSAQLGQFRRDVQKLIELSRTCSAGQLLYRWLMESGLLGTLAKTERLEDAAQLQTVASFFDHLRRIEGLVGRTLPEIVQHVELFESLANEPIDEDDAWAERVNVLTIHKAKGLEFPVVFLVGLVQGRFPTVQRRDAIELPEALIKDLLPAGDYHLQEERRLFYVGMTRAREALYLTASYDYGGKTIRKISQFVLEAMNLALPNPPAKRASARELIARSDVRPRLALTAAASQSERLRLDAHGVDDYLTCPLKYRYSHVLRIPVMRHHVVAYGTALHKAVEEFFTSRLQGVSMGEEQVLQVFERAWSSEGFLSREHEELRLAQGRDTLRRFLARQQTHPEAPSFIEERFTFVLDDLLIVGRWDRVDRDGNEVIIIDYKSSEVHDQAEADRRTRQSLQLLIYALAWKTLHAALPTRVELRFLETDLIGRAQFTEDDLERARQVLREAARGIRAGAFTATPQEHECRWCAFQSICPFTAHAR